MIKATYGIQLCVSRCPVRAIVIICQSTSAPRRLTIPARHGSQTQRPLAQRPKV